MEYAKSQSIPPSPGRKENSHKVKARSLLSSPSRAPPFPSPIHHKKRRASPRDGTISYVDRQPLERDLSSQRRALSGGRQRSQEFP